jgi:hypothetical protein
MVSFPFAVEEASEAAANVAPPPTSRRREIEEAVLPAIRFSFRLSVSTVEVAERFSLKTTSWAGCAPVNPASEPKSRPKTKLNRRSA